MGIEILRIHQECHGEAMSFMETGHQEGHKHLFKSLWWRHKAQVEIWCSTGGYMVEEWSKSKESPSLWSHSGFLGFLVKSRGSSLSISICCLDASPQVPLCVCHAFATRYFFFGFWLAGLRIWEAIWSLQVRFDWIRWIRVMIGRSLKLNMKNAWSPVDDTWDCRGWQSPGSADDSSC